MKKNSNYLTIEEVISIPEFQDTSISEDGQRVAYVRKTPDWDNNTYRQHVWVYDGNIDKSYPLTIGKNESLHPRWSPDSQNLAYLSPVGEGNERKKQIFIQTSQDMGAIQISHEEQSVENFKWAPDGKGIFFTANRPETEKMKLRKKLYGEFTNIDQDFHFNTLYYLDIEKGKQKTNTLYNLPKDLYEKNATQDNQKDQKHNEISIPIIDSMDLQIQNYDVSPNGKTVVFITTPTPRMIDLLKKEIYILDLNSKEIEKLETTSHHAQNVMFSHDGSKICYGRYVKEKMFFNNIELEIYDLKSKRVTQPILDIDENVIPVRWIEEGILVIWQEKTNYRMGILSEDGKMTPLVGSNDTVAIHPSITSDGKNVAYIKATSQEAPEIYLNDRCVTELYKYYEGKVKSQKEIIHWTTKDGLKIEGILSKPIDYDSSRTYPLIVVVHGGPIGTSLAIPTMNKYQPIEQFVEKGFIVLEPNYRGSAGYGEAFRKANYRQLGLGDYEDIVSGMDVLIEKGMVSSENVGIVGWSQGGYISAFCATYSNRFKAISVGAGISNWMTYYVNTDITHFTRFYLGKTPWEDEEIYRKTSPMTYINNASTPTLIQHGEKDSRVPVPNAYELYRGLKDVGVETKLVIFKGMEHGSDKPGIHRVILKQNLDWFSHYILGEPADESRSY
ncbi:S9 family peptidase [Sutcliffiella rhizosphaerae]|uniref:S9 family peptidase n=1 Tax=Sutcliffiella rhizosphaerae TaxID=2880967 RepID=UPI0037DA2247